jgi:hypothetical protein
VRLTRAQHKQYDALRRHLKRELVALEMPQRLAASRIGKSAPLLSRVLRGEVTSQKVLRALGGIVTEERASRGLLSSVASDGRPIRKRS